LLLMLMLKSDIQVLIKKDYEDGKKKKKKKRMTNKKGEKFCRFFFFFFNVQVLTITSTVAASLPFSVTNNRLLISFFSL